MNWKEELEKAVNLDAVTDPKKLEPEASKEYILLDELARKLTFLIHDAGLMNARNVFSSYWTDMSSGIQINDQNSGYITQLKLEREMGTPFYHTIYVLVTNEGLKINCKYITISKDGRTLGDDGLAEDYKNVMNISLSEAKEIEESKNTRVVLDTVMTEFVQSYKHFLESINKFKK
ncbi:MAG: hypothetical protein U0354_16415 [Candidatus Sericytochromatia bacterium]